MAGTDRTAADRVEFFSALAERPYQFDFYQALRRFETLFRAGPRLGRSLRPADDPVRLSQEPSLAFAPATLASFKASKTGGKPRLSIAFGGLFGPQGPLPLHLTEYARDRIINSADPTFARFLDVFHHRMLSLVYRAWADAQPTVQFDRPESDRFSAYVGSLSGIGQPSLLRRDAMPDLAKLYFAGQFACHTRHADGLQAMLSEFFGLPMKLVEFVGRWLRLPEDCRCVLGGEAKRWEGATPAEPKTRRRVSAQQELRPPELRPPELRPPGLGEPGAGMAQLGVSATIGEYVWDCQTKFRIVAGPMNFADYQRLLPGADSLARLAAIVKNYVGLELDWELHLVLEQREVPMAQLGSLGQLGWTTWLVSQPRQEDAADLILSPQTA